MLSILIQFADFLSVNLKIFHIAYGTDAEVQSDASVIPQMMRYQKPILMTENFCLESPKARALCIGTTAEPINFDRVSGDVGQEKETASEAEPESQAVQMVGVPYFREKILMKIVNVSTR